MENLENIIGTDETVLWKKISKENQLAIKTRSKKFDYDSIPISFCLILYLIIISYNLIFNLFFNSVPNFMDIIGGFFLLFCGISILILWIKSKISLKEENRLLFNNLTVEEIENYFECFIITDVHIITRHITNNLPLNEYFQKLHDLINDFCEKERLIERILIKSLKKVENIKKEGNKFEMRFYFLSKNHNEVQKIINDKNKNINAKLETCLDFKGFDYFLGYIFTQEEANELIQVLRQLNPNLDIVNQ